MFFDLSLLYEALLLLQFTIYSLLSLLSAVWGTTAFTIYNLQFTIFFSLLVCRLRHQPCAFFAFAASSSRSALFPVRRKQVDFLKNGSRGGIFAAFCEVGR